MRDSAIVGFVRLATPPQSLRIRRASRPTRLRWRERVHIGVADSTPPRLRLKWSQGGCRLAADNFSRATQPLYGGCEMLAPPKPPRNRQLGWPKPTPVGGQQVVQAFIYKVRIRRPPAQSAKLARMGLPPRGQQIRQRPYLHIQGVDCSAPARQGRQWCQPAPIT